MSNQQAVYLPTETELTQPLLARWWMLLGVSALAVPGLFAIILVIGRSPSLSSMPVFSNMFAKALVVHVDLLVLVWFLSIAFMLWSLMASTSKSWIPRLEEYALICFFAGMVIMTLSVFDSHAEVYKSNYIPVIMSPIFFIGLSLLLCGLLFMLVRILPIGKGHPLFTSPEQFALWSAALIAVIALAAFVWSYQQMPADITGEQYYDLLFWGGGHRLQFVHTQILMLCWLFMLRKLVPQLTVSARMLYGLFSIGVMVALLTPVPYLLYEVYSFEHRQYFTHEMMFFGGIAPAILGLWIIPILWKARAERRKEHRALWSAILMSLLVFLYGGVLGGMIEGENVTVPAHYHGSIVGITLAFMGMIYLLLPRFGYRNVLHSRLAYWQPIICGIGQMLHISGLAWSGGYGVLRKTPGGLANAEPNVKIAMTIMEWGGLLAVVGGVMFILVIWKAVRNKQAA